MVESLRTELFLKHYSGCERWLFAYLTALLGNREDTEEVFQETTLALWSNFADFQEGTDFARWAKRVAFYRVLNYRKKNQRQGIPQSEEFLNAVHLADERKSDLTVARLSALERCIQRLPEADRRLVSLRYASAQPVSQWASRLGTSESRIRRALKRIRVGLMKCIERTLASEGST